MHPVQRSIPGAVLRRSNNGALGNISFGSKKNPVTVDNSFFTVCAPGSEPSGMATCTGATPLNGTGFQDNGGTGWLTTTAPVQPGEVITLSFIIFDGTATGSTPRPRSSTTSSGTPSLSGAR